MCLDCVVYRTQDVETYLRLVLSLVGGGGRKGAANTAPPATTAL